MAAVAGVRALPQTVLSTSASQEAKGKFQAFFAQIRETVIHADKVATRVEKNNYLCHLFMKGERIEAATAFDRGPFASYGLEKIVRIHFMHGMRPELITYVAQQALEKGAQALVMLAKPNDHALQGVLKERGFIVHREAQKDAPYNVFAHTQLQALIPASMRDYKGVTLKKIYIHMIRDGRKTVEGRIDSGMFKGMREGQKVRFFYMGNPEDDVFCTITEVKTCRTFREMLEHYGVKACVPDQPSLESAVRLYQSIPGYADKEKRFGVVGFKLRVDPVPHDARMPQESIQRKRAYEDNGFGGKRGRW